VPRFPNTASLVSPPLPVTAVPNANLPPETLSVSAGRILLSPSAQQYIERSRLARQNNPSCLYAHARKDPPTCRSTTTSVPQSAKQRHIVCNFINNNARWRAAACRGAFRAPDWPPSLWNRCQLRARCRHP
jgi:hypothetical protein